MSFYYKIKRKIYKLFNPAIGDVLMLHRVVGNRSVLDDNRLMEITPEGLEELILKYQKLNYDFISLDELYQRHKNGTIKDKKFVCFTFDDGYIDNYEIAYPILKKFNCPFAIYITTDFPDGRALLWWYILEDILLNNNEVTLGDGSVYICNTIESKNLTFRQIREKIFSLQNDNMNHVLINLFQNYQFSFPDIVKDHALSWSQINELSESGLCTIASHSVSHAAFDRLTPKQIEYELMHSKQLLESHINKQVNHFAYPYGRYSKCVFSELMKSGYNTACLANMGVQRIDFDPYVIKRIDASNMLLNENILA
jgi:peptidoglycan/xylan/chitin deacetylase (PgdA/CDA1 family)